MLSLPLPSAEARRLAALRSLQILDTPPEERFDRITRLATRLFDVPIALVSLVDENRQWFKSCQGLDISETPRGISFCAHALDSADVLVIPDATTDPRFADNPLVTGDPHIRFYAGCPLRGPGDAGLGTLCILDRRPRTLSPADLQSLRDLAAIVQTELHLIQSAEALSAQERAEVRSRTLLAAMAESTADALLILDAHGTITSANPSTAHLFGYAPDALVGADVSRLVPEAARNDSGARAAFAAGRTSSGPGSEQLVTARRHDGSTFTAEGRVVPVAVDGSRLWLLTLRDVTERARAERALRESEQRLRAVTQTANDAIITADGRGAIAGWNNAAAALFGYAEAEVLGRPLALLMPAHYHRAHAAGMARVQATGTGPLLGHTAEFQGRRRDGSEFPIELSLSTWESDGASFYTGIIRDISRRKQTEARVVREAARAAGLLRIGARLNAQLDLDTVSSAVCEEAIRALNVPLAAVSLYDEQRAQFEYRAGVGGPPGAVARIQPLLRSVYDATASLDGSPVVLADVRDLPDRSNAPLYAEFDIRTAVAATMFRDGQIVGGISIATTGAPRVFSDDELALLQGLADQAAQAITNARLFANLERANVDLAQAYDTTLDGWSRALDLRDKETEGHSRRVTAWTVRLAEAMGLSAAQVAQIRRGALLHDIGKMGVPDAILLKPGPLTDAEWVIMRKHPEYAYALLAPIPFLAPALDIPYCHHEKWDGSGYPRGLQEAAIPIAARIFAVVDVWDALRSDRPYRAGWPEARVRAHIQAEADHHFDPAVVDVFLRLALAG